MECNKKGWETENQAKESLEYSINKGYIPKGNYVTYECNNCFKWHFGHEMIYNVGQRMKQTRRGFYNRR